MEPAPALADLISQYLDYHRAYGRSDRTIGHYQDSFRLLRLFVAERGLPADGRVLTTPTMRSFAAWLRQRPLEVPRLGRTTRSEAGLHGVMKDLRAFTRWLIREQLIPGPVEVPVPKVPEQLFPILTPEEMARVWQSSYLTGRSSMAIRNRALIGLMLDTGIRRGEVCSLTLADVDFDQNLIKVTGKGQKQRLVPFVAGVRHLLEEWIAYRGDEEGSLFWLQPAGLRMVFRRIQAECGLARFHPHLLRHQAATEMVRNNIEGNRLQIILGHRHYQTTQRYLSLSPQDVQAGHAAASPFNSLVPASVLDAPRPRRRVSRREE